MVFGAVCPEIELSSHHPVSYYCTTAIQRERQIIFTGERRKEWPDHYLLAAKTLAITEFLPSASLNFFSLKVLDVGIEYWRDGGVTSPEYLQCACVLLDCWSVMLLLFLLKLTIISAKPSCLPPTFSFYLSLLSSLPTIISCRIVVIAGAGAVRWKQWKWEKMMWSEVKWREVKWSEVQYSGMWNKFVGRLHTNKVFIWIQSKDFPDIEVFR